jgi:hypothetical protein
MMILIQEMTVKGELYTKEALKEIKQSKETNLYQKIHNTFVEIEAAREQKNYGKLEAALQSLLKSLQKQVQFHAFSSSSSQKFFSFKF